MKNGVRIIAATALAGVFLNTTSCLVFERWRLPPGHAKKVEQDHSSKEYAPRQKKK
jgi:hypothetical protein